MEYTAHLLTELDDLSDLLPDDEFDTTDIFETGDE